MTYTNLLDWRAADPSLRAIWHRGPHRVGLVRLDFGMRYVCWFDSEQAALAAIAAGTVEYVPAVQPPINPGFESRGA